MCSNPYLNIFQLYFGFKGSKQIVTLWGCLYEQIILWFFCPYAQCVCITHFNFQFSIFGHFNFQNFQIFSIHFAKRFQILVFQFSTFNIHTSRFKHFSFQNFKFQTFHTKISIFNFLFLALSFQTPQLRHFSFQNFRFQTFHIQFSIFSFQYSHNMIQAFQLKKIQTINIPYTIVPWQVWHLPNKQLINFEYSIFENKIFLKILYFPS